LSEESEVASIEITTPASPPSDPPGFDARRLIVDIEIPDEPEFFDGKDCLSAFRKRLTNKDIVRAAGSARKKTGKI
jgi:hypothetical protein